MAPKKWSVLRQNMDDVYEYGHDHFGEIADIFKARFNKLGIAEHWYSRPEF